MSETLAEVEPVVDLSQEVSRQPGSMCRYGVRVVELEPSLDFEPCPERA